MRVLRVKLYQEYASYRTPWSFENVETFPLPPYSSLLGLIHAVLKAEETLEGISLSVQGRFGGLIRNYVRYRKYKKKDEVEPYPILVSELHDVEILVHIATHDDLLEGLQKAFLNPPKYLHLGRYEDLIRIEEVKFTEVSEKALEDLPYDAYVPEVLARSYDVEHGGILYTLPFYYHKRNGRRIFKTVPTYYLQAGTLLEAEVPRDDDGYPVFLTESDHESGFNL